jgi:DnaJ-class molecular chaperone
MKLKESDLKSGEMLKSRYHELAKSHHPDSGGDSDNFR